MLELVALLVVLPMLALRRRTTVVPLPATFVLPAMDVAPPRRRLARGSVEQPATPLPDELPRRPLIRPSHARR